MELLHPRCAGLDVAKDELVACVRVPDGRGGRAQQVRTFQTFTSGLEALAEWLAGEGVTQVVMEATGQYWKPIWYVLEEAGFELMLVNARHVKILPGRKTDVCDAAWLAELLEHVTWRTSRHDGNWRSPYQVALIPSPRCSRCCGSCGKGKPTGTAVLDGP